MSYLTCHKCKSDEMNVETRHSCSDCEHNGFYLDPETAEELGVEEKRSYYDEKLRLDAEKLTGKEIFRTEVEDNGECNSIGSTNDEGCTRITCSKCKASVEEIPFVSC